MCGIAGMFGWYADRAELAPALDRMCDTIIHRGPDDRGTMTAGGVALGMTRLSIIDVAGGHQPIYNEDGTVAVVFNGEIYNYRELRERLERRGHRLQTRSDTEVIVHAYEDDDDDCVMQFNGIFAFALWDSSRRRLLLARDRAGVKPLYYVQRGEGLAFASEIKALLTLPGVDRTADLEATAEFLRLGFVQAPRTLFHGIRKLPAGWRLIAEDGKVRTEPYWDLTFRKEDPRRGFEACRQELVELLRGAVRDQMVSDVPLGAFLSGGVDSTAVVAFMREVAGAGVRTFSIGFDGAHGYHNEAPYAERVARHYGTEHETLIVQPRVIELLPKLIGHLDEPLTDTSFLVSYLVSQVAHRHVKVAMSGVGGDELFGGYRRYLAPTLARAAAWLPRAWRREAGALMARRLRADRGTVLGNLGRYAKAWGRSAHLPLAQQYLGLVSVLSSEQAEALLGRPGLAVTAEADFCDAFRRVAGVEPADALLYVDAKTALPESLLLLTDKMGMATSLEVRVPFLDNRVLDFVQRIPSRHRLRGFTLKRLLKAALRDIVPDFVLTRSKRGFGTPMGTWLRGDLRPLVDDLLGEARLRRAGLFNSDAVRRMRAVHDAGQEDHTEAIFALLAFEVWREQFGVSVA
jgi:asparagine synthase (glutamine-hydrolysing)